MDNQNQRVMANESKCKYWSIKAYSSGTGLKGWNFNNFDSDLSDYSPYQVLVLFQIGKYILGNMLESWDDLADKRINKLEKWTKKNLITINKYKVIYVSCRKSIISTFWEQTVSVVCL